MFTSNYLALSAARIHGSGLEFKHNKGGVSLAGSPGAYSSRLQGVYLLKYLELPCTGRYNMRIRCCIGPGWYDLGATLAALHESADYPRSDRIIAF
jgi:hypothetical protein